MADKLVHNRHQCIRIMMSAVIYSTLIDRLPRSEDSCSGGAGSQNPSTEEKRTLTPEILYKVVLAQICISHSLSISVKIQ